MSGRTTLSRLATVVRRPGRAGLVAALALTLLPAMAVAGPAHRSEDEILGHDGQVYPAAPWSIDGNDGDLYLGLEYDNACEWGGKLFDKGMERLARLARVIELSGRRAFFTVAPAKAEIVGENFPRSALPHGSCDTSGLRAQRRLLNSYPDPTYVSARKPVARDPRQTYWKTDVHWTEVGVSDYVGALVDELDPRLARLQRYRDIVKTQIGFLYYILGIDQPEVLPTLEYAGSVDVRTTRNSLFPMGSGGTDMSWRSTPARKTWPGHTLLLGDSFTMVGLGLMAPLFRHGRFLWNKSDNEKVIAEAIAASDTVVIEVYQTFLYGSPMGSVSLRKAVKRELRHDGHGGGPA